MMNSFRIFSLTSSADLCPLLFCFSLFLSLSSSGEARDTITAVDPIHDRRVAPDQLVSARERFVLGFFTGPPPTTRGQANTKRYIGIWYRYSPATIVWVANRHNPLAGFGGTLCISEDGRGLEVRDAQNKSHFNVSDLVPSVTSATLNDSGNLILRNTSGEIVWQSFEHPTDTILPGMEIDRLKELVSWRSPDDPSNGTYSFKPQGGEPDQYVIYKNQDSCWTTQKFDKTTTLGRAKDYSISDVLRQQAPGQSKSYATAKEINFLELPKNVDRFDWRLFMNSSGRLQFYFSENETKSSKNGKFQWVLFVQWPSSSCALGTGCGKSSLCTLSADSPACNCLPGYTPESLESWNRGIFSAGCRTERGASNCNYTFEALDVSRIGKEDLATGARNEEECEKKCRSENKCQCQAYYAKRNPTRGQDSNISCWLWYNELTNMEQSDRVSGRLHVRRGSGGGVPYPSSGSATGSGSRSHPGSAGSSSATPTLYAVVCAIVIVVLSFIGGVVYFHSRRARRRNGRREGIQGNTAQFLHQSDTRVKELMGSKLKWTHESSEGVDVPFFGFESILAATGDFSDANKLGKGGFGPVYKGTLQDGQQIAVKRLSSASGQGLEEFKNEVVLIAKLQHRNLVRLLGYCIEGEEKVLIYEYMPNKSLDAFIFDPSLRLALEWKKRFDIVLGIARGLLYLHQDSRLRIIHRDLKTSNILLDEEMSPKISDFGLAKIFGGKQTEGATNRVVGTYGYMSPEYAIDGFFSVKSDVFSFGVILLEIISGKRNIDFYQSEGALNLLGHAWSLWREENALDFMDQSLEKSCNVDEVLKCIQVGLLCVQENPNDRPTMATVVTMLSGDGMSLVAPKEPAFIGKRGQPSGTTSSTSKQDSNSNRMLTITIEEGR